MDRKFEIWTSEFRATGEYSPVQMHGHSKGKNFRDACQNFFKDDPAFNAVLLQYNLRFLYPYDPRKKKLTKQRSLMKFFKKIRKYFKKKSKLRKKIKELEEKITITNNHLNASVRHLSTELRNEMRRKIEDLQRQENSEFEGKIFTHIDEGLKTLQHPTQHTLDLFYKDIISILDRVEKLEKNNATKEAECQKND